MHRWCLLNLTVQGFSLNLTVRGVSNKHCLLTFLFILISGLVVVTAMHFKLPINSVKCPCFSEEN